MNRIFLDLDGVIVDFEKYMLAKGMTGDECKREPGAYLAMEPIEGALAGVRSLIGMGFEIWIATKPPTGLPWAYADKVSWVLTHLPELKRRIILTHHKGLLGDERDYLVDDHPLRANCDEFMGELLTFGDVVIPNWEAVLNFFRTEPHYRRRHR